MTDIDCDEEHVADYALASLQVMARLGIGTLYLYICSACNHPSVHQSRGKQQFCPCCSDVVPMGQPAFSSPTGPLLVK